MSKNRSIEKPVKKSNRSRSFKFGIMSLGFRESLYQSAVKFFLNEDFTNAFIYCLPAANNHHKQAEWLTWLRRAAKSGNSEAQLGLGMMLSTGAFGTLMNIVEARYWYQQALENGEQRALWYLERLP